MNKDYLVILMIVMFIVGYWGVSKIFSRTKPAEVNDGQPERERQERERQERERQEREKQELEL